MNQGPVEHFRLGYLLVLLTFIKRRGNVLGREGMLTGASQMRRWVLLELYA